MLNKDLAPLVGPLVNNQQIWEGLEKYLQVLLQLTVRGLVTAQSESELRQLQGKAALLETLLNLRNNHQAVLKQEMDGS
jgi:hypothetical protein